MDKTNLIVLFYPEVSDKFYSIPYALLSLERMVRDMNVEVALIDERHQPGWRNYVKENRDRILLAGVSAMTGNQIISGKVFSLYVKECTTAPVVWGGWFVTELPELALNEPFIDMVVRGQGERTFSGLVQHLLHHTISLEDIPGLGFRKNGTQRMNAPEVWMDTYTLPRWNFDLLDMPKYLENEGKTLHYIASQGCPCSCNFCLMSSLKLHKYIHNPAERVIEDIVHIKKQNPGLRHIKFNDDNLLANRSFALELCNSMIEQNLDLHWTTSAHIGLLNKNYSMEDLLLLKKAGCSLIYSGAESGDNEILRRIDKRITPGDITKHVRRLKKAGIGCSCSFMVGFPGNGTKDLKKTLKLIMRLFLINRHFKLSLGYYLPLPDNKFRTEAVALGFQIPQNFGEYERSIHQGFQFPWITPGMRRTVQQFMEVYMPAIDKEYREYFYPEKKVLSNIIFSLYAPVMYLRLALKMYEFSWDAKLILWIMKKLKITSDVRLAKNSVMQGIRAIGY